MTERKRGRPPKQVIEKTPASLARELAERSIVTQALTRYIEQILTFVHEEQIQPLLDENERLKKELAEWKKVHSG